MSRLSENIKNYRADKGLSQKDFADLIENSRDNIANWENDRAKPDYDTLGLLATLFDCTTDYLLGRTDNRNAQVIAPAGHQSEAQYGEPRFVMGPVTQDPHVQPRDDIAAIYTYDKNSIVLSIGIKKGVVLDIAVQELNESLMDLVRQKKMTEDRAAEIVYDYIKFINKTFDAERD